MLFDLGTMACMARAWGLGFRRLGFRVRGLGFIGFGIYRVWGLMPVKNSKSRSPCFNQA